MNSGLVLCELGNEQSFQVSKDTPLVVRVSLVEQFLLRNDKCFPANLINCTQFIHAVKGQRSIEFLLFRDAFECSCISHAVLLDIRKPSVMCDMSSLHIMCHFSCFLPACICALDFFSVKESFVMEFLVFRSPVF